MQQTVPYKGEITLLNNGPLNPAGVIRFVTVVESYFSRLGFSFISQTLVAPTCREKLLYVKSRNGLDTQSRNKPPYTVPFSTVPHTCLKEKERAPRQRKNKK
jgi:hypothetical protein